jgi:hypothetical protein
MVVAVPRRHPGLGVVAGPRRRACSAPVLLATPASTNFSGRQDAGLWAPWLRTRGRVCTSTAHGSRVPCLRPRSSNAHGSAQFLAGRGTQNLARRRPDHSSGRIAAHGNNGEQQRPVPFFGPAFNSLAPSLNTTVTCQVQAGVFNVFSVYGFLMLNFLTIISISKQNIHGGSIREGSTHEPKVRFTQVAAIFSSALFWIPGSMEPVFRIQQKSTCKSFEKILKKILRCGQ